MKKVQFFALGLMLTTAFAIGSSFLAPTTQAMENNRHEQPRAFMEQVEIQVHKTKDGFVKTMTTHNAEALEFLQQSREDGPSKHKKGKRKKGSNFNAIEVNRETLANGVQVTLSSEALETVEHLHEKADRMIARQSITRSVENISNGAVISITSTLPEVVEKLQSREQKESRNPHVTKISEKLDNGVKITITTEDQEMVEKLQDRMSKQKGKSFRGKHFGKQGKRGSQFHKRGVDHR